MNSLLRALALVGFLCRSRPIFHVSGFREDKSTDVQQPSSSNLPPEHYASSVNRKLQVIYLLRLCLDLPPFQLLSKELDMAKVSHMSVQRYSICFQNVGAATDKDLIHAENKRKKLDRRSIFELVNSGKNRLSVIA